MMTRTCREESRSGALRRPRWHHKGSSWQISTPSDWRRPSRNMARAPSCMLAAKERSLQTTSNSYACTRSLGVPLAQMLMVERRRRGASTSVSSRSTSPTPSPPSPFATIRRGLTRKLSPRGGGLPTMRLLLGAERTVSWCSAYSQRCISLPGGTWY